jgi:hypothetical protein
MSRSRKKNVSFKGGDFEFLPFGSGRRMCAGMNFPTATVELMLANLVHRFDWVYRRGRRVATFCVAGVRASSPPERETSLGSKIACVLVAFFPKTYWDMLHIWMHCNKGSVGVTLPPVCLSSQSPSLPLIRSSSCLRSLSPLAEPCGGDTRHLPPLSLNVPEALNIRTNLCILSPSSPITLILC